MSHLFFDCKTNDFHCRRCDERMKVQLPMSIDMFVGLSKLFAKEHKRCEPMRVEQSPTSGIGSIIGKWPGSESSEEIEKALDDLS